MPRKTVTVKERTKKLMAKRIKIEYDGVKYTLEYSRKTVQAMEEAGFRIDEMDSMPMTMLPKLFSGAFLMHHSRVKRELVDEIFDAQKGKTKLLHALTELYLEPFKAMFGEDGEDEDEDEGNFGWVME